MTDDIKTKIRTLFDKAYNQGDMDILDKIIAPDYMRHQPPMKPVAGFADYIAFIRNVRSAYSDFHIEIQEVLAEGNKTVTRMLLTGKHTGQTPTLQAAPTGRRIAMPACVVSTWEDGRIVEEWVYNDYLGLVQQFGVIPLPGLFA